MSAGAGARRRGKTDEPVAQVMPKIKESSRGVCVVFGCPGSGEVLDPRTGESTGLTVRSFGFSSKDEPGRAERWRRILSVKQRTTNMNIKTARVCERHFGAECFAMQLYARPKADGRQWKPIPQLKKGSSPTLFMTAQPNLGELVNALQLRKDMATDHLARVAVEADAAR